MLLQKTDNTLTSHIVVVLPKGEKAQFQFISTSDADRLSLGNTEKDVTMFEIHSPDGDILVHYVDLNGTQGRKKEGMRKAGHLMTMRLNALKAEDVCIYSQSLSSELLLAYTEGMILGNYRYLKHKSNPEKEKNSLQRIYLDNPTIDASEIARFQIVSDAVYKCRDWVNEPVSGLNTEAFCREVEILMQDSGVRVEIFGKKKIEALKMGGLLAVNQGSIDPPAFIILEYLPENPVNSRPLVFVGKGVVFDTGGLNLKTGDFMNGMKCDMAGAAAVGTAISAIAKANLPVQVIGLIPLTDNRPGNNALAPGDIITFSNGTTVEVLNTDAEGRLILADALSYAGKYEPMLCINLATLTGAASRAIGKYGLVAMEQDAEGFLNELKECGESVYERLAIFPFWDEYGELIKSEIADLKNIGPPEAGMITAGKFLAHFTSYPFIHLDIAGPAFLDKADSYRSSGGSGTGVRLLFEFCEQLSKKENAHQN